MPSLQRLGVETKRVITVGGFTEGQRWFLTFIGTRCCWGPCGSRMQRLHTEKVPRGHRFPSTVCPGRRSLSLGALPARIPGKRSPDL